jgi:tetratricopeptide (TPR) repeat protein
LGQARIELKRGFMATADGRLEESLDRLQRAYEVLSRYPPGPELAEANAEIARLTYFLGRTDDALASIERALPIAEQLFLPEVLSQALNTKALILKAAGRTQEALALLRHALRLALEHDAGNAAQRAYNNLASVLESQGAYQEIEEMISRGLALTRKLGHRAWEAKFMAARVPLLFFLGRWDEAVQAEAESAAMEDTANLAAIIMERSVICVVHASRGDLARAEKALGAEILEASQDVQALQTLALGRATIAQFRGDSEDALSSAQLAIDTLDQTGVVTQIEVAYAIVVDATIDLGDLDRAGALLAEMEEVSAGSGSPFLRAEIARIRGRVSGLRGDSVAAARAFEEAVARFRAMGLRFHLAVALSDFGRSLEAEGRAEEAGPIRAEAREIFEDLQATWWLERVDGSQQERTAIG